MPATIASASAIWGTHLGLTKEVNSMVVTPVAESASTKEIFASSVMAPFSNWKPSRGPTSRILTRFGRSLIR